jgi:hypothetical protein
LTPFVVVITLDICGEPGAAVNIVTEEPLVVSVIVSLAKYIAIYTV